MKTEGFLRYGMMDGLFYAWCASFTGFITSYFLACGLSASKLSTMLAVYMITCFAGALFWGGVCDKLKTNRKVFIASFAAVILIAGIITVITPLNVNLAIALYPVMGFLLSSLGSNLDAWMLRNFHKDGTLYGKARAIGSLGYSLTALAAGMIINTFGYSMIQPLQIITGVLTLIMAFFLKELPFGEIVLYFVLQRFLLEMLRKQKAVYSPDNRFLLDVVNMIIMRWDGKEIEELQRLKKLSSKYICIL